MNLEIARKIAEKAHAGQKRKNGEDYINHCIRVSDMAADYSEKAAIVGMLHDTIEDSSTTFTDLKVAGADESICWAISLCTHANSETYLEYILEIKKYWRDTKAGKWAYIVKLADLEDNLNGTTGTLRDKYIMAYYILTGEVYE